MNEDVLRSYSFLPTALVMVSLMFFIIFWRLTDEVDTKKIKKRFNAISSIAGFFLFTIIITLVLQKLGEKTIVTGLAIGAIISFQPMKRFWRRDLGFSN
jgi:hypothetical protein